MDLPYLIKWRLSRQESVTHLFRENRTPVNFPGRGPRLISRLLWPIFGMSKLLWLIFGMSRQSRPKLGTSRLSRPKLDIARLLRPRWSVATFTTKAELVRPKYRDLIWFVQTLATNTCHSQTFEIKKRPTRIRCDPEAQKTAPPARPNSAISRLSRPRWKLHYFCD